MKRSFLALLYVCVFAFSADAAGPVRRVFGVGQSSSNCSSGNCGSASQSATSRYVEQYSLETYVPPAAKTVTYRPRFFDKTPRIYRTKMVIR